MNIRIPVLKLSTSDPELVGVAEKHSGTVTEIVKSVPISEAERIEQPSDIPALGSWWWVDSSKQEEEDEDDESVRAPEIYDADGYDYDEPGKRWLACVARIGTNYIKLTGRRYNIRVHVDRFHDMCEPEPNPLAYTQTKIHYHRERVRALMGDISELCHRLGVPTRHLLGDGLGTADFEANEASHALAIVHGVSNVKEHQKALEKAKKETLPELYKLVEQQHEKMAKWMRVEMLPAEAELARAKGVVNVIDAKIDLVKLYAGLAENLIQVRKGKPAALDDRIHLVQRRHYMDEECLARYEAGGMSFEQLGDFDKWLARPENMVRIFPWSRTIVAFRIRRFDRRDDSNTIASFIKLWFENQANEATFLYIRNGDQIWRLETGVDFPSELFPHKVDNELLADRDELWVKRDGSDFDDRLVRTRRSIDDHRQTIARYREFNAQRMAQWVAAGKPDGEWQCVAASGELFQCEPYRDGTSYWSSAHGCVKVPAKTPGKPYQEDGEPDDQGPSDWTGEYEPLTPDSLYYDDALDKIRKIGNDHNRIAVIVQGLLDRSTCLHPHPPWKIFTPDGMAAGIELVYDVSRGLSSGPELDFEAYRAQLNKSIRVGAYTIGQYREWERQMVQRWGADYKRNAPGGYGNTGPAKIARVVRVKRNGDCVFEWKRERVRRKKWSYSSSDDRWAPIPVRWTCPRAVLTCIDAYTPGDYRMFFDDPRTRLYYVKWAPILLSAENWHARRVSAQAEVDKQRAKAARKKARPSKRPAGYRGVTKVDALPVKTGGISKLAETFQKLSGEEAGDSYLDPFEADRGFDDADVGDYAPAGGDDGEE